MTVDLALRIQAAHPNPHGNVLAAEVKRLRATIRSMSENEGKLHARIANLETEAHQLQNDVRICQRGNMEMIGELKCHLDKLARVEALPARWHSIQPPFGGTEGYARRCVFEQLTEELEAALQRRGRE